MSEDSRLRAALRYEPESGEFFWVKSGKRAGSLNSEGYRHIGGQHYKAHRLAWLFVHGRWPARDMDHINGIRDDNRIANLRECTKSQNHGNRKRPRTNTSGFKGVTRKGEKWAATIYIEGRNRMIGVFLSPESAHEAYCAAARQHFGEFARAA